MKRKPTTLVTGLSANQYQDLGNIIHQPLIEIEHVEIPCEFFKMLLSIYKYDYIVFTNRNAVHHFMNWLYTTNSKYKTLSLNKIISIGQFTTTELEKHGIRSLMPEQDSPNGIIKMFQNEKITNSNILIPRSDIALNVLPEGLRNLGNSVDIITVYHTRPVRKIEKIDLNKVNNIVFTSPSGVMNFLKLYGTVPSHVKVITRGEQTQNVYDNLSSRYK